MDLDLLQAKRAERNKRLGVSEAQYIALRDRMHELQWQDATSVDAKEIHAAIHVAQRVTRNLLDKHGIR